MSFLQIPPALGNQYDGDRVLRSLLARLLPPELLREVEPGLREMGELAGGRGLALFYLETGYGERLRGIRIDRLKDKLGTRKLPTAEQPLHRDTLQGLEAEWQGALHLTFRVVELIGRAETGELDDSGERLLRLLTPVAKLTTARQAVAVTSECLEAFGGAGYVEDTGLPVLLRDAQVLTIWEGTTNVLALDALRAMGGEGVAEALREEAERCASAVSAGELLPAARAGRDAIAHALAWLAEAHPGGDDALHAGARRFALTLARALELLLLAHHAQWSLDHEGDGCAATAARRLAAAGVDSVRATE